MIIKKEQDAILSYLEDSSNMRGGRADMVAFPENDKDLSSFLELSFTKKRPVTISGGGTGTTGSRVPFGGTVLSLEKMNRVLDCSLSSMSCAVQAGILVEDLKNESDKRGLFYASHPTEKTATAGGAVATNASGARSFKYGPTRRLVRRLKMFVSSGEPFELRRGDHLLLEPEFRLKFPALGEVRIPVPTYRLPSVKSSAGYFAGRGTDLIDLFIGQEGTLSVVTEIEFDMPKKPSGIFSAFVFFKSDEDALNFADEARYLSREGDPRLDKVDALSIEYFDINAVNILRGAKSSIPPWAEAAVFIEQEAETSDDGVIDVWAALIRKHSASLEDAWARFGVDEATDFLKMRHLIPESINDLVRKTGRQKLSTDIAVPAEHFRKMTAFYKDVLRSNSMEHVIFGHIGECHLHVNLMPGGDDEYEKAERLCRSFIDRGIALGGTVSAEHGIGKTRHKYLEAMFGKDGIMQMARIKKSLDPRTILGLDNIFPKEVLSAI